ncbi:MAG: hypothetical protein KDE48_05120 [Anaerolineales bacterium]|nr:hypothetical protein [Anaerolineales bacterium]
MLKKITLITLLVLFSGVLVVGAANRTIAKTEKVNEIAENTVQGQGSGERQYQNQNEHEPLSQQNGQGQQGQGSAANADERQYKNNQESLGQGQQGVQESKNQGSRGQGNGLQEVDPAEGNQGQGNQGQGNRNNSESNAQNRQQENLQTLTEEVHEWLTITGSVLQAPTAGVDMILQTADGELLVGTGPDYLGAQGYVIEIDDELEVTGFWENDEFKVSTITNLADGSTIALRDELGRPFWSGAARGGGNGKQQ